MLLTALTLFFAVVNPSWGTDVIGIDALLKQKDKYTIVDFRSTYLRELNGYITDSKLIDKEEISDEMKTLQA